MPSRRRVLDSYDEYVSSDQRSGPEEIREGVEYQARNLLVGGRRRKEGQKSSWEVFWAVTMPGLAPHSTALVLPASTCPAHSRFVRRRPRALVSMPRLDRMFSAICMHEQSTPTIDGESQHHDAFCWKSTTRSDCGRCQRFRFGAGTRLARDWVALLISALVEMLVLQMFCCPKSKVRCHSADVQRRSKPLSVSDGR